MRLTALHKVLVALLGAVTAVDAQQYLLSELSFGHSGRLVQSTGPDREHTATTMKL